MAFWGRSIVDINGKPLYQMWSEEDFAADIDVQVMNSVQRWMYRTLLQKAFVYKTRPNLPSDDTTLWKLSGCESLQQWLENKSPVLEMFSREEVGGVEVLYRKRLRDDWEKIIRKRETLSDAGRASAETRWGVTNVKQMLNNCLTENAKDIVSIDIVRESKEEESATRVKPKELNAKKIIPQICREKLGIRTEKEEWYKAELDELCKTYGGTQVVSAFETWADQQDSTPRSPVKTFIRVADGFLQNRVKPESPELDALCVSLYKLGGQAFTGTKKQQLNSLLAEFSFQEIEKAYKEFISTKDEYDMKFAIRDFCEGGGKTVLIANRQRQEEQERTERFIEDESARLRSEAEQELKQLEENEGDIEL